jgi:hypothetical protein
VEVRTEEFQDVQQRHTDLSAPLVDGSVLHIEIQGQNHRDMPYREGMYCLMIGHKYNCKVRQVVLYVGQAKMKMQDRWDLGDSKVAYRLIDIREFDAEELLRSERPGDLALAMLARGGTEKLKEITRRAADLSGPARIRALTQMILLSGLRGLSGRLKMEMKHMGSALIDVNKNEILRDFMEEAKAEGRAEGRAEVLQEQLRTKFGRLPKWAEERISRGSAAQVQRWVRKILTAETLEGVLGKK